MRDLRIFQMTIERTHLLVIVADNSVTSGMVDEVTGQESWSLEPDDGGETIKRIGATGRRLEEVA